MKKELSSQEDVSAQDGVQAPASAETGAGKPPDYSRREAVKALAKYSAVLGGAAAAVVSAEGLVSEASAYATRPRKEKRLKKLKKAKKLKKSKKLKKKR